MATNKTTGSVLSTLAIAIGLAAMLLLGMRGGGLVSYRGSEPAAPGAGADEARAAGGSPMPEIVSFNRHIQPILSDNCFHCHGPDSGSRKADLRLDRGEFAFADRAGGPAIVKGDPAASPLMRRVESSDPAIVMPPPETHKTLSPRDKALLAAWIRQGAAYEEHWSLIPPARPAAPAVKRADWIRNPVDAFVLARLEREGLEPNGPEEPGRLLRRASLALTGLPPSPEELDAFLADPAPDAYEKAIDRLLASPRYGEHMARYWLDAARYADTHGIHIDNYRSIWPYRDWVIRAFNDNMPFDRFTVEQLAGDLLPGATRDQRVATGFHRCNATTSEGGAIDDEYYAIYAKDRVETTAATWMGLTMGCASCHDHKFDPVSQKEFYQFAAFFRNTTQKAMDGNVSDTPPVELIPAPADEARWEAVGPELAETDKRLAERRAQADPEMEKWLAAARAAGALPDVSGPELLVRIPADEGQGGALRDTATGAGRTYRLAAAPEWLSGTNGPGARLLPGATAEIGDLGDFESTNRFSYGAWVRAPEGSGALLARMNEQDQFRGWDLWFENGRVAAHLIHQWDGNALKVKTKKELKTGGWTHVFVTYDGSGKASGLKIHLDGESAPVDIEKDSLSGSIRTTVPLALGRRSHQQAFRNGAVRDLRLYARALDAREVLQLARRDALWALAILPPERRDARQTGLLRTYFLETADEAYRSLTESRRALVAERDAIRKRGTVTLVMEEKNAPPFAHVLKRGEYDQPGEKVFPGVPAVLPPLPADAPSNRLGLARWMVSTNHPLTARVTVNREWQNLFGAGLVLTAEDFGVTGERPVHPELLDWLAVEFVSTGWDLKRLHRLLVTSAAFRQSARTTPEKLSKDPANRLLSRGPRHRLDGETIRDLALFAGGLLVEKTGGPSVKPYQPDGIWETVAMPQSDTRVYKMDDGEKLYRRSLYTFWKRSAPPPSMEIFNAPTRESCVVRRERTNTPLQALVTMNDPQFVEAARALAARALARPGTDDAGRLDFIARCLMARPLRDAERAAAGEGLRTFREDFAEEPAAAAALLKVGRSAAPEGVPPAELAAWTLAASQLMNLDETLTL